MTRREGGRVQSTRRSYPQQQPKTKRRSPFKLLLIFLILVVLASAIVLGVMVLSPDLTSLVPGSAGERLHGFATAARDRFEALLSDEGPLGGVRRVVEPYLSRVHLSLSTVLLGLGLILLAILCVRILAVTSKSPSGEAEEVFGPEAVVPGEPVGPSPGPYWPYERRPGRGSGPGAGDGATAAGMPSSSMVTTGDAWPMIRAGGSDLSHEIRGSAAPSPELETLAGSDEGYPPPLSSQPLSTGSGGLISPLGSDELMPGEAAAATETQFATIPPAEPVQDYLADMPVPAYVTRAVSRAPEEPLALGPRPDTAPAAEVWVESRPRFGLGLKKFVWPGLFLFIFGAGGAYGFQTPVAAFITGGPYGIYLLGTAVGLISMIVSMWFMNGPMRASVKKAPGVGMSPAGRLSGGMGTGFRPVAPAPIPARAALKGGLEAPDAADWGKFPKPSVFLPGTQAATSVGVDIGTAWTKVVQIGVSRHGPEILNLGLVSTPEGVLGEGDISDPDLLGETIKDLLSSRNITQRQVTTALGGQGVIIRHVQFPVMSPDELREVLRWEAEHHIPIPPAEAVVDFTVMPGQVDADERGNRQMRVMLVGAQKRVVEAQVQALRRAKLYPKGVDAEALACYRVIRFAGHFEEDPLRYAQAVIDLGHSSTKLGIYLRGALEMSRTLGVGGRTFTSILAERLRVPEVEAETLKRQYGVHPDGGRVLQTLVPTLQDLMFEIRRSFEFFASRHFGQSVRYVYLVGGGARMPGIAGALARYLNPLLGERVPEGAETRVEVIDPLAAMALSPRLGAQANLVGPEFVTALGLALSEEETTSEG